MVPEVVASRHGERSRRFGPRLASGVAMSSMPPLVPREHGAYCEIAVPLLTALWMRPPTFGTVAWTVAAVAAFVSHEPMLVLLGRRGARVRKLRGRAASILLAV